MSPWRVILATMVIFGCGVVTGGLLMRTTVPPPTDPVAMARAFTSTNQPPPITEIQRPAFLHRLQKQLDLTPAQSEEITKIMKQSQEKTGPLWREIVPRLREEVKRVREEIRQVLNAGQQKKFDELVKPHLRKTDNPGARPARPPVAAPAQTNAT